jgi:hypothetical protein
MDIDVVLPLLLMLVRTAVKGIPKVGKLIAAPRKVSAKRRRAAAIDFITPLFLRSKAKRKAPVGRDQADEREIQPYPTGALPFRRSDSLLQVWVRKVGATRRFRPSIEVCLLRFQLFVGKIECRFAEQEAQR